MEGACVGMEEYLSDYLDEAKGHIEEAGAAILLLEKSPGSEDALNTAFRAMHTLKGMSAAMGFEKLASFCHGVEGALDLVRQKARAADREFIDAMLESLDALSSAVDGAGRGKAGFDFSKIGKKLEALGRPRGRARAAPAAPAEKAGAEPGAAAQAVPAARVSLEKLDSLLGMAGELVVNSSRLAQLMKAYKGGDLRDAVNSAGSLAAQMHDAVLQLRLVEAGQVFSRFPRMVRDIAKREGKEVDFEMSGVSIELDRAILEKVAPAIVHLLRNAVDHGIEGPESRKRAGKPARGKITLAVSRQRNTASVAVEDDGAGMSSEGIKKAAVERKLITARQASGITGDGAFQLLFLPGFSTSAGLSETSGRGVGLNSVKASMAGLGGAIDVHSAKGRGAKFGLSFPLSVAIVNSLVVLCAGERYALPLSHVLRTSPLKSIEVKRGKRDFAVLDGEVPLVKLSGFLGVKGGDGAEDAKVVLLEAGSMRLALLVDGIAERQGILVKPLDSLVQKSRMFTGASVLGNGKVVLVLDVPAIFEKFELNA